MIKPPSGGFFVADWAEKMGPVGGTTRYENRPLLDFHADRRSPRPRRCGGPEHHGAALLGNTKRTGAQWLHNEHVFPKINREIGFLTAIFLTRLFHLEPAQDSPAQAAN
jgi:hypothetical protein